MQAPARVSPAHLTPGPAEAGGSPALPAGSPCCCLTSFCPAAARPGGGAEKPCS